MWARTGPREFPVRVFFAAGLSGSLGDVPIPSLLRPRSPMSPQLCKAPGPNRSASESSRRWAAGGGPLGWIPRAGDLTKPHRVEPFLGHSVSKPQRSVPTLSRHPDVWVGRQRAAGGGGSQGDGGTGP